MELLSCVVWSEPTVILSEAKNLCRGGDPSARAGSLRMTGLVLFVAVCLTVGSCRLDADSISKFFKPPKTTAGSQLSPTGINPNGQLFPIGLYSVSGNSQIDPQLSNMARVAQNGFTYAGPYYGNNWQDFSPITQAAGQNLKFVFQIRPPASVSGVSVDARPAALAALSDAALTASVHDQVAAFWVIQRLAIRFSAGRWELKSCAIGRLRSCII